MAVQSFTDPDFSRAVQLLQSGRLAEAEQQIDLVLKAQPNKFEPQHLAAVIAFKSGHAPLAIERLKNALKLAPDHAQGLSDLGMMLHASGAQSEAEEALDKALQIAPEMAAAHLNLGMVLHDVGKRVRAERHFREALRLQPKMGAALNNLSLFLLGAGRAAESLDLARQLIELSPKNALGHGRLGAALDRLGRLDEAIVAYEAALNLRPKDVDIRLEYARSLAGYGRIEAAVEQCRLVLENDPNDTAAIVQLSSLVKLEDDPDLLGQITEMWNSSELDEISRANLGFALSKSQERQKKYETAFATLIQSNAIIRKNIQYDRTLGAANANDVVETFDADRLARMSGIGHGDEVPIFIVGMPRSGTTLTEQILCAAPGVFGAGEPGVLRTVTEAMTSQLEVKNFGGLMGAASAADLQRLGADYVRLMRQYSSEATRIIDKVPANFTFVGLIHLCLPNAKIIHCRRAAADTCLSIFKNKFATGAQLFSYDLDDLAAYYAAYRRIMTHWDEVLPGVVHTVQYEKMVADQRGQSELLYTHCGLNWTDDAMSFFKTERPVHTASTSQVRQPIYDASSGITGRYGAAARPLIEALERAGIDPFAL